MDKDGFLKFLKGGGQKENARVRVIKLVQEFEQYLQTFHNGMELDAANPEEFDSFISWSKDEGRDISPKIYGWALAYYYKFISNEKMRNHIRKKRAELIKRKPFKLKKLRSVNPEHIERLATIGITDVAQMLEAGSTKARRLELAKRCNLPIEVILEFVKLSDLARIPGVKAIRARLYFDVGIDSIEKMAMQSPEKLREICIEFVERTGFSGIAPLPKEAEFTVRFAKKLPIVLKE
jgi:hypothetical protein